MTYEELRQFTEWVLKNPVDQDQIKHAKAVISMIDECDRLKRIVAKELRENDDLGSEFVYVQALKEENQMLRKCLSELVRGEPIGHFLIALKHIKDADHNGWNKLLKTDVNDIATGAIDKWKLFLKKYKDQDPCFDLSQVEDLLLDDTGAVNESRQ